MIGGRVGMTIGGRPGKAGGGGTVTTGSGAGVGSWATGVAGVGDDIKLAGSTVSGGVGARTTETSNVI